VDCGSDEIISCRELPITWMDSAFVVCTPALSVTCTVKAAITTFPGVPLIVPVALRLSPVGRAPELIDHVYGEVPPVALSPCEYAFPSAPAGNDDVVIVKTWELIASDRAAMADTEALSVTLTVKLDEPMPVGVPDIVPPARLRPAGSDPLVTVHVYGGDPPVALSPWEYTSPIVPAGKDDVVIVKIWELIASDRAMNDDNDALSVTRTVKLAEMTALGMPEIVPPARLRPGGSDPLTTVHVYGGVPPDALSPCEYAVPTVPSGNDNVVMARTGALIASDKMAVADRDALSVTLTVKLDKLVAAGVPDNFPSMRLSPGGSDPLATDHV
jgi:hypothetical protein